MAKVSIIVAIYNQEKYLGRCVDSLVNQTLQDIEIILVNDGSTDSSLQIALEYAKKDSRVIVLSQENAKQGAARNRGLEIAQGEFVTYVDSDDWIELDYCELLYNAAVKSNANIAAATTIRNYKNKSKYHLKLEKELVFNGVNSIIEALQDNFITHGKLYRFEPIKQLRFQENVFYEDGPYTLKAFNLEQSLVTVPDAIYHYYSNPSSTIKQKLDIRNENDKIETSLDFINYAKENNIKTKDWCIFKENHLFYTIKHYIDRKDLYILGIKINSKLELFNDEKVFLVFNTACLGDVLLCNSLCQNIKLAFPNSKIIFITDKKWMEVAKYQQDVDEVVVFDKKGVHKGFVGMLKFIKEFKYKKPFASFITYKNERNTLIAKLLHSRFTLIPKDNNKDIYVPYRHSKMLEKLTHKKIKNLPIKFNLPETIENPIAGEKYVVICCISKNSVKDMSIEMAIELINDINQKSDCKVVLTGTGEQSVKFVESLTKAGVNFINLVNKTSLMELGAVLKESIGLITVDTGTMHFACSMGVKTLCLFFEKGTTHLWAPQKDVYKNTVVLSEDINVAKIINNFENLRNVNE